MPTRKTPNFFDDVKVIASCFARNTLTVGVPLYAISATIIKCLELINLQENPSYFALFGACELLAALDTINSVEEELKVAYRS